MTSLLLFGRTEVRQPLLLCLPLRSSSLFRLLLFLLLLRLLPELPVNFFPSLLELRLRLRAQRCRQSATSRKSPTRPCDDVDELEGRIEKGYCSRGV